MLAILVFLHVIFTLHSPFPQIIFPCFGVFSVFFSFVWLIQEDFPVTNVIRFRFPGVSSFFVLCLPVFRALSVLLFLPPPHFSTSLRYQFIPQISQPL